MGSTRIGSLEQTKLIAGHIIIFGIVSVRLDIMRNALIQLVNAASAHVIVKPLNKYHRRICEELSKRGIPYMEEYRIGQRQCDLYIPDLKKLVELDGPTHWPSKDRERDEELRASRPDLEIVHIKVGISIPEAMEVILGEST